MVAPSVPSILLTPMAPHSLSFRPIVLPETSDIVIHSPHSAPEAGRRASASASVPTRPVDLWSDPAARPKRVRGGSAAVPLQMHATPGRATARQYTRPPLTRRVAFDGKNTQALKPGDSMRFMTSHCPLPMITAGYMDNDWFSSITEKLMWNAIIKKSRGGGEQYAPRKQLPLPKRCALHAQ